MLKTTSLPSIYPAVAASFEAARHLFVIDKSPRSAELQSFVEHLKVLRESGQPPKVIFICTHNSRRSQLGQFWLTVAARVYGLSINVYSGGTETTACHPNTLNALRRAGAKVAKVSTGENPHYAIRFGNQRADVLTAYSKLFNDIANPKTGFAALMVCSEADQGCPYVAGVQARFSVPYTDPKYADNTPNEAVAYDTASQTIAAEMAWVASQLIVKI